MEPMGAAAGGIYVIVFVFLVIVTILTFLLPFFVFRIRNEAIKANEKLDKILTQLIKQRFSVAGGKK